MEEKLLKVTVKTIDGKVEEFDNVLLSSVKFDEDYIDLLKDRIMTTCISFTYKFADRVNIRVMIDFNEWTEIDFVVK